MWAGDIGSVGACEFEFEFGFGGGGGIFVESGWRVAVKSRRMRICASIWAVAY